MRGHQVDEGGRARVFTFGYSHSKGGRTRVFTFGYSHSQGGRTRVRVRMDLIEQLAHATAQRLVLGRCELRILALARAALALDGGLRLGRCQIER